MLHEILEACKETTIMSCVSLDAAPYLIHEAIQGYQIRMKCDLDNYARNCLMPILEKHELEMNEEHGFVILYPKT